MITKTLRESLALEARLGYAYQAFDAAASEWKEGEPPTRKMVEAGREVSAIKKRMYKLPNYNRKGLEKISNFLARVGA